MFSLLRDLEGLAEKFPSSREDYQAWWQKHGDKLLLQVKKRLKKLVA